MGHAPGGAVGEQWCRLALPPGGTESGVMDMNYIPAVTPTSQSAPTPNAQQTVSGLAPLGAEERQPPGGWVLEGLLCPIPRDSHSRGRRAQHWDDSESRCDSNFLPLFCQCPPLPQAPSPLGAHWVFPGASHPSPSMAFPLPTAPLLPAPVLEITKCAPSSFRAHRWGTRVWRPQCWGPHCRGSPPHAFSPAQSCPGPTQ